jgi:shikimate kinase
MILPRRIVLIGFMGSGKSTVGAELARRLGRPFVDTDALVAERAGAPIQRIFDVQGEAAFRAMEAAALEEAAGLDGIVAATGGGAPAQPGNARFFGEGAAVFHLRVSLATALARAGGDTGRPLLRRSPEAVQRLWKERRAVYEAIGTGIETDGRTPLEIAGEIMRVLGGPTATRRPAGIA